ncbi:hypothetical protein P7D22_13560 [Lichenihabitans sp. Uapishka_5]|uniref:hypothetical protein n=1 Tax=Lichenihabitans sp. Uapishka_5 TaxID=3037302 RepID=UPI0029E7DB32|nr:hypothetical protein [Lichenihabitans sp. Uapishka_5]MDX7952202.1 hypothetical protein [Lichenihabitans sp. Uapishka_5]
MSPRLINWAEIAAYNAGVEAVLAIAGRASSAISATTKRHVHESFAVAALSELVEAGRALLIPAESAT